eukprot:TRINITY_DN64_c4_g1_i2.p2 TRINITY_DN64_c4_g1~~TRINITY_DN64_c4_g1_i2.p2  ORF type:complete len:215 (+),score=77.67 TRINITY_DN64_c4_g1_i2:573-1217(+)
MATDKLLSSSLSRQTGSNTTPMISSTATKTSSSSSLPSTSTTTKTTTTTEEEEEDKPVPLTYPGIIIPYEVIVTHDFVYIIFVKIPKTTYTFYIDSNNILVKTDFTPSSKEERLEILSSTTSTTNNTTTTTTKTATTRRSCRESNHRDTIQIWRKQETRFDTIELPPEALDCCQYGYSVLKTTHHQVIKISRGGGGGGGGGGGVQRSVRCCSFL